MIPIRLALRNFMCYRDNVSPLDFEGIHVACLSGDNGNGKSAILDAITWALWGQARAKSDDDLIYDNINVTEMEVEFEFEVAGNLYRAVRKRSKPSKRRAGQTLLELHLRSNGGFQPITGNTVRDTQRKITEILRMDYPTFTNSAFLLQGHADEFTVKIPSERKKVLAEILGLSLYDQFEERARSRARESEKEESILSSAIKDIDAELAGKGEYESELSGMVSVLAILEQDAKTQEAEVSGLRQAMKGLEDKRAQLAGVERRVIEAQRELAEAEKQAIAHRQKAQEYESRLSQGEEVRAGYAELVNARKEHERLGVIQAQLLEVRRKKAELEKKIEAAKRELVAVQRVLQNSIAQNEAKARALPSLEEELAKARLRVDELDAQETQLAQAKERAIELSNIVHGLKSANEQLKTAMKELKEKIDLLEKGQDTCPLCETELGEAGRKSIQDKYQAEGLARKELFRSNEKERDERQKEYEALQREVDSGGLRLRRERDAVHGRLATLSKDVQEAKSAAETMVLQKARLSEVEPSLAQGDFAAAEQAALLELADEEAKLGYDPAGFQRLRDRLAELEKFDTLFQRLDEAERLLPQETGALQRAESGIARWRSALEKETQLQKDLSQELASLPEVAARLRKAEEALQELQGRLARGREGLGAIREKLAHCAKLEVDKREKTSALGKVAREKSLYDELAVAFGKKGIQALIIEAALPEIEEEANSLLARMTDNRMHVKIETQRDTRRGDTIETLDIKISDELGTRSYEMFSGGEAFRINFALRIALSKLLARRAGAPLPTLVIDEGFGTQDGAGRYKLVEAISSIQDDFKKIIVVTHIEELKEAFPVRIDVTKTEEGSSFSVSVV